MTRQWRTLLLSASILLTSLPILLNAGPVTIFSAGFTTPETISLAPASFGLPAGTLVVTDATTGNSNIYSLPSGGGAPTGLTSAFTQQGARFIGGIFASSAFGLLSGDYLAFAQIPVSGLEAVAIYSLAPGSSTLNQVYTSTASSEFSTPTLAPAGFGSVAGDILFPATNYPTSTAPTLDALSSTGAVTTFATLPGASSSGGFFGTIFAPAGFVPGSTGTVLLVSDSSNGAIDWIDSSGNVHAFTTLPLGSGQTGLRQMAFAPAGYGAYGGDLFVSVAGAINGAVDVIDGTGTLVAILTEGTVGNPFNPRGLYFESSSQLLIADNDPSILGATPDDFSSVPEPGTALPVALLLAWIAWHRIRPV